MTDPMDALNGLQAALNAKTVQLQRCELHPEVGVLLDTPRGTPRFTYAQVQDGNVQAIALFVVVDGVEGLPCFQVGYAVAEPMRGQGLSSKILRQGIDELRHGLSRTPMREFYLEAVVSDANIASNKIARRLISDSPKPCNDDFSGEPAQQYLGRFTVAPKGRDQGI